VHAYQGLRGVVRTCLLGLLLGGIFLATGSLIPGQALHTGIDLSVGAIGVAVASRKKIA
jgi:hypothetical protein